MDDGELAALPPGGVAPPPGSPRIYDPYHQAEYAFPFLAQTDQAVCSSCESSIEPPPAQTKEWGAVYDSLQPRLRLDYQDFSPDSTDLPGSLAEKSTTFRDLVDQANLWLRQNPTLLVQGCETLVRPGTQAAHVGDTESMCYYTGGHEAPTIFSMALRLWVCPSCRSSPVQLEYRDFVAAETDTLQYLIRKVNRQLEEQPVKGKMMSCETLHISTAQEPDPELTVWHSSRDQHACASQRLCIRVFFQKEDNSCHIIGLKTFFPDLKKKPPEMAVQLLRRATSWLALTPCKRVLNIQTVFVPFTDKECPENNAERCYRSEPDFSTGEYLQVIRVFYTESLSPHLPRSRSVRCKLFSPVQYHPDPNAAYEQMRHTVVRANAWLDLTGADVLCAESFFTIFPPSTSSKVTECLHWTPPPKCNESRVILHIRLFVEGDYSEPDPRQLPPLPTSTTICETLARHRDQRRLYLEKRKRKKRKKAIIGLTLVILVIVGMVIFLDQTLNLIGI